MLRKIANGRLKRNLSPDLSYAWHTLNHSVMLPLVLGSSRNDLFNFQTLLLDCKFLWGRTCP